MDLRDLIHAQPPRDNEYAISLLEESLHAVFEIEVATTMFIAMMIRRVKSIQVSRTHCLSVACHKNCKLQPVNTIVVVHLNQTVLTIRDVNHGFDPNYPHPHSYLELGISRLLASIAVVVVGVVIEVTPVV